MGSKGIISGFIFISLIITLIGASSLAIHRDAGNPKHIGPDGMAYKGKPRFDLTANAPLLLEEAKQSFKARNKYTPAQAYLPFGLHKNFNASFWADYQNFRAPPPTVTIHSRPKYILFHALIIPS